MRLFVSNVYVQNDIALLGQCLEIRLVLNRHWQPLVALVVTLQHIVLQKEAEIVVLYVKGTRLGRAVHNLARLEW